MTHSHGNVRFPSHLCNESHVLKRLRLAATASLSFRTSVAPCLTSSFNLSQGQTFVDSATRSKVRIVACTLLDLRVASLKDSVSRLVVKVNGECVRFHVDAYLLPLWGFFENYLANANLDCAAKCSSRKAKCRMCSSSGLQSSVLFKVQESPQLKVSGAPTIPPAPLFQPGLCVFSFPQARMMFCCIVDEFKRWHEVWS